MDQEPKCKTYNNKLFFFFGNKDGITIKLLVENIEEKLHNTGFHNDFLNMTPGTVNKRMNRQPGLQENFLNVYFKRHNPQSKKATHRMGVNICKSHI